MSRSAPSIILDPATRTTLNGLAQAASTPQALALRSRIILEAATVLNGKDHPPTVHAIPEMLTSRNVDYFYPHDLTPTA